MPQLSLSRRSRGFTLLELMITVAVIAVIASVGYPMYTSQATRAKRAEGRNALMDAAAREERKYSDTNKYTDVIGSGGLGFSDPSQCSTAGTQTETCKYTLTAAVSNNNQQFTLTATPTFADTDCGALVINQAGQKGIKGVTPPPAGTDISTCWGK